MKVAKIKKKQENKKEFIEEKYSVKEVLLIVLIVLITFILFYFITYFFVKKDNQAISDTGEVSIDTAKITFNNLLNRNENEYYVLAYKSESTGFETNFKDLYDKYIQKYTQNDNALKFYYIDMDDAFNNAFIGSELTISNNLSELKINDEVLFKINNGEIEKSYVGKDKIFDKLSRL